MQEPTPILNPVIFPEPTPVPEPIVENRIEIPPSPIQSPQVPETPKAPQPQRQPASKKGQKSGFGATLNKINSKWTQQEPAQPAVAEKPQPKLQPVIQPEKVTQLVPKPDPEPEEKIEENPEEDLLSSSSEEDERPVAMISDEIICTFTNVKRNKNKWKLAFKNGVMHVKGKDYLFSTMTGESEW